MSDVEEWRKIIAARFWKESISEEEQLNLAKCICSVPESTYVVTGIIGGLLSAGAFYKIVRTQNLKYIGVVTGCLTMMASKSFTVQMCISQTAPSLLHPKNGGKFVPNSMLQEHSTLVTPFQRKEELPKIITEEPTAAHSSALEFDDPVSSTQSFSDDNTPTLILDDTEKLEQKKSVTYEELRRKHREEYERRIATQQEQELEASRNSGHLRYKRVNKYGDEIE